MFILSVRARVYEFSHDVDVMRRTTAHLPFNSAIFSKLMRALPREKNIANCDYLPFRKHVSLFVPNARLSRSVSTE